MDAAKRKRILKLLDGRKADREQAVELLAALADESLWAEALTRVRTTQVAGIPTVYWEDLPLLAAAPDELAVVREIRARFRTAYFSTAVSEDARCLTHLEEVHLTAAWGADLPVPSPSLGVLAGKPVEVMDLIGVDLEDGGVLEGLPLRALRASNCTWSTLPTLPTLEELHGRVRTGVTTLGAGLPGLRRLELDADGLVDTSALSVAARLEEASFLDAAALPDLQPLAAALSAGAPLRKVRLLGAGQLREVAALGGAAGLLHAEVEVDLTDLRPFAGAAGLTWLAARRAPRLRDLRPLAGLRALRCLDLRGCSQLDDLAPVRDLPALRVLALHGTRTSPSSVPARLRPYCTWAEDVALDELVDRPRHPDDGAR